MRTLSKVFLLIFVTFTLGFIAGCGDDSNNNNVRDNRWGYQPFNPGGWNNNLNLNVWSGTVQIHDRDAYETMLEHLYICDQPLRWEIGNMYDNWDCDNYQAVGLAISLQNRNLPTTGSVELYNLVTGHSFQNTSMQGTFNPTRVHVDGRDQDGFVMLNNSYGNWLQPQRNTSIIYQIAGHPSDNSLVVEIVHTGNGASRLVGVAHLRKQ